MAQVMGCQPMLHIHLSLYHDNNNFRASFSSRLRVALHIDDGGITGTCRVWTRSTLASHFVIINPQPTKNQDFFKILIGIWISFLGLVPRFHLILSPLVYAWR